MMRGSLRFRSLAYYRDYEDGKVRGDDNEGTSIFRPEGGLRISNETRRLHFDAPNTVFESEGRADEIFVYCLSCSDTPQIRQAFHATACVEIFNIPELCLRVRKALPDAMFSAAAGSERVGRRVKYYDPKTVPEARWACPDLIACSKLSCFGWQDEFRLLFSMTDALHFQHVQLRLVASPSRPKHLSQHDIHTVDFGDLSPIARMKGF
jgi:hypothetical protein